MPPIFVYNRLSGKDVFHSVIQGVCKKIPVLPTWVEPFTFWLLISPDALPLSYRRLVGAKDTKLGSCDKHPENCSEDCRTSITYCIGSNTMWMILCFLIEALLFLYDSASGLKSSCHSHSLHLWLTLPISNEIHNTIKLQSGEFRILCTFWPKT